ncbi:hypothetical protein L336_0481 [Candidatus Saccharimonas aalborgensis]|uniref:Bacterial Ig-like domain-containing protein n=1 Tax=Candidatus Saccharimonas aalborgensis TaxID=1332188 RepID=R4PWQ1_9BACT|nr:Ig-like domain-containing protein [Candidatus Saccharimonas aalborgensis]AGL62187.1 hypothetical protein L336_0481 [Candidatus Saccharimonas aalborgensis]QQS68699.1 MAG: hypothetical protein IPP24_01550 [Candidatus Saccharibacteria bacterium]
MVDSQKQNSRLNTAISNAGRRYNTEVNLQIHNILGSLYALNRDSRYITDLLKLAYKLKHQVAYRIADHKDKNAEIVKLKRDIDNLVASLIAIKNKNKNQNIRWKSILTKLDDTASAMYELYRFLKDLQDEERKGDPYAKTTVETGNTWSAYQALNDIKEFLSDKRTRLFNTPRMILRGDAGIGKTHLLCDYAKSRIDTGKPTLIFLAHELSASTSTDPIECMASLLQCRTKKAFLDDLQKLTTKSMDRVCIIIDAVNEADQMDWSALKQLFSISNLSVVVSVRNGYESVIKNTNQYTTIEHYGFADMEWEAIDTFFKHHKMKLPEIPIVDPEFRNPLFLSIFCESYAGKKDKTPRGHGATHVFEIYVETQSKKILEEIGLDKLPKDYLWKNVIKKMGILMGNSGNPHVTKTELLSIIRNDTKLISHDDKLIPLMEHHGLVMKYPKYNKNYKRNGYYYGFTYNRFSDHLIVRSILTENKIDTREKAERFFKDGKFLDNNLFNVGLLEALSIQLPERCNKTELVWAVPKKYRDSSSVKTAFLGGVKWRDVDSIDKKTGGLKFIDETQVIKYMNDFFTHSRYDFNNVMDCILDVCAIPSHPLNALRLHKILSKHTLPHRDAWLQEFLLHRSYEDGNAINRLQSWSLSSLVSHASVESTELASNGASRTESGYIIDTTSPVVTITAPAAITLANQSSYPLAGSCTNGDGDVSVVINGITHTTACSGGSWLLTLDMSSLPDASPALTVTASQTDAAGNTGNAGPQTALKDTVAPTASITPLLSNSGSPALSGAVSDPSATVTVTVNGTTYTATNNGDGTWSLPAGTIAPALADGPYDIVITATDGVGNTGTDSTADELTIDKTAPTGSLAPVAPGITNSPALSGTVSDPSAIVTVTVDGTTYTATNNGDGTWSLPAGTIAPALNPGTYDVVVSFTDTAGNTSTDPTTNELVIQRSDADLPTVNPLSASGGQPIITGTYDAENSQSLSVTVNGVAYVLGVATQLTVSGNTWRLDLSSLSPALPAGAYDVKVAVTTRGGAVLGDSTAAELVLSAPANPLASTGLSIIVPTVFGLALIVTSMVLIYRAKQHNKF